MNLPMDHVKRHQPGSRGWFAKNVILPLTPLTIEFVIRFATIDQSFWLTRIVESLNYKTISMTFSGVCFLIYHELADYGRPLGDSSDKDEAAAHETPFRILSIMGVAFFACIVLLLALNENEQRDDIERSLGLFKVIIVFYGLVVTRFAYSTRKTLKLGEWS